MHVNDFVKQLYMALDSKTLYVYGCFGAPMNSTNRARYSTNNDYNKKSERQAMIKAASSDTFGFDCVGLIKGILWGWNANTAKTYGGASYTANGVPDTNANGMIAKCKDATTSKWDSIEVGECVWMDGHIGVYVGNGLVIEASPKWSNSVQMTALNQVTHPSGYNTRTWTKHGHLPYLDYTKIETGDATDDPAYSLFCEHMARYRKENPSLFS